MKRPFAPGGRLPPDLRQVLGHWRGLRRGAADMPFWDDFDPTALPDLAGRLFLLGVFTGPERYRYELLGPELTTTAGRALAGQFADRAGPAPPFEFLVAQAAATTEAAAPTVYRHTPAGGRAYARLLAPMWGDGRIGMLLGAIDWRD